MCIFVGHKIIRIGLVLRVSGNLIDFADAYKCTYIINDGQILTWEFQILDVFMRIYMYATDITENLLQNN